MRLSSIARVNLPDGSLHVLAMTASGAEAGEVTISYDQRRHVGGGDRAGSWMALAFDLDSDLETLERGWARVLARHGALRTGFSQDDGLRLRPIEVASAGWEQVAEGTGDALRGILHRLLDDRCRPFAQPSHLLAAIVPETGPITVVIASDHAHVDMWSLLVLARDLRDPDRGADDPPADFGAHSALLASLPPAPETIVARWHAILEAGGGDLPVFPLSLGDVSTLRDEVVEVRDLIDADGVATFERVADGYGVRPTALALSVLTGVTRALAGSALRAVFPVHSRNEARWLDSVGWFITNSVIDSDDPDPRAVAAAVKEALALGSHPLAPILGPAGPPPAAGMFAISWLDTRRLPHLHAGDSIRFVTAEIKTDGVMVWFVLNDTGMHLRCRYPDTPEARRNVGRWLDAVEAGIRAHAGA
ncbi:peptide synthetase [Microbacterium sp. CJ88]|uniref:peptide synthetase n=1 Tax=Microbacterium sp. CJ88 TaxID=3445672 RepID=UPI003F65B1D9